jgi:uncharacterized protein with NRDE domain
MCLLAFAWRDHPDHHLVLAGNRDEAHDRASLPAGWWPDAPTVLGGRDGVAGGSWLAVSRNGRFAVVTNHRDLRRATPPDAPSRGWLVRDFVAGSASPAAFVAALRGEAHAGFNLLVGQISNESGSLWYTSNRAPARALGPGRYTLSNATLDEPWPKTRALRTAFDAALTGGFDRPALLAALGERRTWPDAELPDTGLDRARERALSAAHIVSPGYGTRCASVLRITRDAQVELLERRFAPDGTASGDSLLCFRIQP